MKDDTSYLNDSNPTPNQDEKDGGDKKKFLIPIIIIVILAIVGLVAKFIIFAGDDEEERAPETETTTSSPVIPGNGITGEDPSRVDVEDGDSETSKTEDPDNTDGDSTNDPGGGKGRIVYDENGNPMFREDPRAEKYKDDYLPTKEETTNPVPMDEKRESDKYSEHDLGHNTNYMFDNSVAAANQIASISAKDMMSVIVKPDGGYATSINAVIDKYGTDHAKEYGFRKWSLDDHTLEWEIIAEGEGNNRIVAGVDIIDTEYYNDHLVKFTFNVQQRLLKFRKAPEPGGVDQESYAALESLKLDIYMKDEDGKWKIDAYDFPEGKPSLY